MDEFRGWPEHSWLSSVESSRRMINVIIDLLQLHLLGFAS